MIHLRFLDLMEMLRRLYLSDQRRHLNRQQYQWQRLRYRHRRHRSLYLF
jgi:hypothetical protein